MSQTSQVPRMARCCVVAAPTGQLHGGKLKCVTCNDTLCKDHAIKFSSDQFRIDEDVDDGNITPQGKDNRDVYQCGHCYSHDPKNEANCVVCILEDDVNTDACNHCQDCHIRLCADHVHGYVPSGSCDNGNRCDDQEESTSGDDASSSPFVPGQEYLFCDRCYESQMFCGNIPVN